MNIELNNEQLTRTLREALQKAVTFGTSRMVQNTTDVVSSANQARGSGPTKRQVFLGMDSRNDSATSKIHSHIMSKVYREKVARVARTILGSRYYGNYDPPFDPSMTTEQLVDISKNATKCAHHLITDHPAFEQSIEDAVGSLYGDDITVVKWYYDQRIDAREESWPQLNEVELFELTEQGVQITSIGGETVDELGSIVYLEVTGIREIDNSFVGVKLVPMKNVIVDSNATSYHDMSLMGERCNLTRQQIISRHSSLFELYPEMYDILDKHRNPASTDPIQLTECSARVEIDRRIHTVRAIAIGESYEFMNIEDVGRMQYVPTQLDSMWDSLEGASFCTRTEKLQQAMTDLLRASVTNTVDSSSPTTIISGIATNIDDIVDQFNEKAKVVYDENPSQVQYTAPPFVAGQAVQVLEYFENLIYGIAGNSGEFNPSQMGGRSIAEITFMDQAATNITGYDIWKVNQMIAIGFDLALHFGRKNGYRKTVWDADEQRFITYDMSKYPEMKFVQGAGFSSGSNSKDIAILERMLEIAMGALELGLTDREKILNILEKLCLATNQPYSDFFGLDLEALEAQAAQQDPLVEIEGARVQNEMAQTELNMQKASADVELKAQKLAIDAAKEQRATADHALKRSDQEHDHRIDNEWLALGRRKGSRG